MKKFFGGIIMMIGAVLWETGGFWKTERYEDLTCVGKFGYNLMCKGMKWRGVAILAKEEEIIEFE